MQIHDLLSTRLIVNQVYHFQVSYITDYVGKMIQSDSIDLNKKNIIALSITNKQAP